MVVVVVVDGDSVVLVVVGVTTVVVVPGNCVLPGALVVVVVVVVGLAAVRVVVGVGAGFKTRPAVEPGCAATKAAAGVIRPASNREDNPRPTEGAPKFQRAAEEAGDWLGAESVPGGAVAESVLGGDVLAPLDRAGAVFAGRVSF